MEEPDGRLSALFSKVFYIDLIRELILDYVIYDRKKVVIPHVRSVRTVCKDWLRSTTKLLDKSQKVIFRVEVTQENSTPGTKYVQENGKLLDNFVESPTLRQNMCVPLFAIKTSKDFFHRDNNAHILNCLSKCDNCLVELDFPYPVHNILRPLLPNTTLSQLRSFSLDVTHTMFVDNAVSFVQSVFQAAKQLTVFKLKWCLPSQQYFSQNFRNLTFPTSITDITIFCPLDATHLSFLETTPHSNLKTLTLEGNVRRNTGVHIFNILENFSETLEKFCLRGKIPPQVFLLPEPLSTFKIPVMKKLKSLCLETGVINVEDNLSSVQQLMPALQHLSLTNQTPGVFGRWTDGSHYSTLTSLTLSWHSYELSLQEVFNFFHTMEALPTTFPNLSKLDVTLDNLHAMADINCIWRCTNLRDLTIRLMSYVHVVAEVPWDALFTGLSESRTKAIMKSPDLWNDRELKYYPYSVRNLADLERLHLEAVNAPRTPLISDAAFYFGFMKLPKLSQLTLVGGFRASTEMTELWKKQGRFINNRRDAHRISKQ